MTKVAWLSILFCFIGCVSYGIRYDTCLKDSDPKSLQFKDDKFEFDFLPVPNGVHFAIINKTSTPAILQWDRCYFIEPDGNSSKALNVDLLGENIETKEKAKYESILPPDGKFARFTTSALNAQEYETYDAIRINNLFSNISLHYAEINKFYKFGRYWPNYKPKDSVYMGNPRTEVRKKTYTVEPDYDTITVYDSIHIDKGLVKIKDYILNNNKMGLGLSIKLSDTVLDYRFDFRFNKVDILKTMSGGIKNENPPVFKSSSEENNWEWK